MFRGFLSAQDFEKIAVIIGPERGVSGRGETAATSLEFRMARRDRIGRQENPI